MSSFSISCELWYNICFSVYRLVLSHRLYWALINWSNYLIVLFPRWDWFVFVTCKRACQWYTIDRFVILFFCVSGIQYHAVCYLNKKTALKQWVWCGESSFLVKNITNKIPFSAVQITALSINTVDYHIDNFQKKIACLDKSPWMICFLSLWSDFVLWHFEVM